MTNTHIDALSILNELNWLRAPLNENQIEFIAQKEGIYFGLRMNDFPDEDMFTLFVDGQPVQNFNDWLPSYGTNPWSHMTPIANGWQK